MNLNSRKITEFQGKDVYIYELTNTNGMVVELMNYGATITKILVRDKHGNLENVVLSFEDYKYYERNGVYFGATLGRTAGRIKDAVFHLNGVKYKLTKNYIKNNGHGGTLGFSRQFFDTYTHVTKDEINVTFKRLSKHKEEHFPGNLDVAIEYILNNDNELIIRYHATTDEDTLCNLTNHTYFNLSGNYKTKVTEQYVKIIADEILETDETQVPNGNKVNVHNTPFDFNELKRIGKDIEHEDVQRLTKGYDHAYLLKDKKMEMVDFTSGRKLEVTTTYPSVVIYSTNFPSPIPLYKGIPCEQYAGFCFECQFEPNGINHPDQLNTAILRKDEVYKQEIKYKISIIK